MNLWMNVRFLLHPDVSAMCTPYNHLKSHVYKDESILPQFITLSCYRKNKTSLLPLGEVQECCLGVWVFVLI